MFFFPGISLHLSYLTWFSFSNAMKNTKKPETQDRWIGRRNHHRYWSAWSLYYKACRLRFCSSVAACFGGALEGRGRLSAPECVIATAYTVWARDLKFGHSTLLVTLKKWFFFFFEILIFFQSYAPFSVFPIAHSANFNSPPFRHLLMDFQK